jgi:lysosomal acid lipase/cholesteryl ester hydrolase
MVIYQHGLLDSSATPCTDGLESMTIFLEDCGFDVWLNDFSGNKFSRNHKYLDPDVHMVYWTFSFWELTEFDLPALFDFVLSYTNSAIMVE